MEAMTRTSGPGWLDEAVVDTTPAERATEERWQSIFAALAEGQVAALDELYDLASTDIYRLALWRTGSSEDAEDVVQDVFVRVAEQGRRLASVRHPRRWLLTVAHRITVDLCRGRRRRSADPLDDVPYLEASTGDSDRAVDARTASGWVGSLPEKQREVLLLHHFADCTFADIGRITGVPTFTAASRHRLAIAKLRRFLENSHDASK
jgi:RNA polymerase sigma-70 factor (ECF subfamily)